MHILYDTSVAIGLRDGLPAILSRHVEAGYDAVILAVTMVELEGGVARAASLGPQRRASLDAFYENVVVLPFTSREAGSYAHIVARLGFARAKIIDRMIAATALTHELPMATLNAKDFRDVPGLLLQDWAG